MSLFALQIGAVRQLATGWLIVCALALPLRSLAQEKTASSTDEALQKLRAAGARVQQISANEPVLEVSFQLASQEVNDQALAGLNSIPQVIWLNLAGTKITDAGLKELSGMEALERLHLEKTAIGDSGIDQLLGLAKLQYLNLYGTQVSDSGLAKLAQLKQLKRVYVWQSQVTDEGIRKLREALPECRVVGEVKLAPAAVPANDQPAGQSPADGKPAGGEADGGKAPAAADKDK
jgi:hypothetical protein